MHKAKISKMRVAECNVKKNLGLNNVVELLNQSSSDLQASCFVKMPVLLRMQQAQAGGGS